MKVFALSAKTMQIIAKYLIGILPISLSNILVHSLRMYQVFAVCRTCCTNCLHSEESETKINKISYLQKNEKFFKKTLKKVLTNGKWCGNIDKFASDASGG